MRTQKINGLQLEKMLKNGLAALCESEDRLNKLNVFPVPDGDTGTNMRFTMSGAVNGATASRHVGAYLKSVSSRMLMSARGNSGVILSQLFKGLFTSLSRASSISPSDYRNALVEAYKTAYSAVAVPVEGTVLTVAREGIENIKNQIGRSTSFEELLSIYIAEMRKSLASTPDILPVLQESGVIDSGALGYITIVEGMLDCLYGRKHDMAVKKMENTVKASIFFNENSVFSDGYCVEYLLQLLKDDRYDQHFRLETFGEDLKSYGSSIVTVQDASIVKVHVHTMKPSKVLALAQEYGEFISVKIENMQLQHNEVIVTAKEARKDLLFVAWCDCESNKKLFKDMNCQLVFLEFESFDVGDLSRIGKMAENVVLLPCSPECLKRLDGIMQSCDSNKYHVIRTESTSEIFYALAMDIPDEDAEIRISEMKQTVSMMFSCVVKNKSANYVSLVMDELGKIENIDDKESLIILQGQGQSNELEDALNAELENSYPDLSVTYIKDGNSKNFLELTLI